MGMIWSMAICSSTSSTMAVAPNSTITPFLALALRSLAINSRMPNDAMKPTPDRSTTTRHGALLAAAENLTPMTSAPGASSRPRKRMQVMPPSSEMMSISMSRPFVCLGRLKNL